MIRTRFLSRHLRLVTLACLAVAGPGHAALPAPGHALIVGISRAGGGTASTCPAVAASLRDRLTSQGLQVSLVSDPGQVAFRAALDNFAAVVSGAGGGATLIYVCAPAVVSDTRLFVLAHADGPTADGPTADGPTADGPTADGPTADGGPETQGVVAAALLNTLAPTSGTLYADLALPAGAPADQAILLLGRRLPAGTHLAIARVGRSALVGEALAGDAVGVTSAWPVQASALAARAQAGQVPLALVPPAPTPQPPPPPARPAAALAQVAMPVAAIQAPAARPSATPKSPAARQDAAPRPLTARPIPVRQVAGAASSLGRLAPLPTVAVAALPTPPQKIVSGEARGAVSPQARHPGVGRAADSPGASRRVARVQAALIRIGLYHGPLDGDLDGETLMAIRTFQQSLGDPASGALSGREIVRLLNP